MPNSDSKLDTLIPMTPISLEKEPESETQDIKTDQKLPELPPNVKLDKNGQWRDKDTGQLLPGTPSNPKTGRPRKLVRLDKYLKEKCGNNLEKVLERICEIAMYDPDKEIMDSDGKMVKRARHYYSAGHQITALQMVMAYYFGKPQESKQVDIKKDININGKLTSVAQLVSRNAPKVQDLRNVTPKSVLEKDADEIVEDIIDVESD